MDYVEVRYGGNAGIDGIGCIEIDGVQLTMTNSIERDGGHAGLYSLPGSNVKLTCDLFVGNSGNGVQLEAGSTDTLINNTIDGNAKFGVVLDSPTATLVNNLITNNGGAGVDQTGPTSLTMSYNDVYNPAAGTNDYIGLTDPTGTNGNLSADPKYFNEPSGQYELHPGSPAEDAGTGVGAPTTDFLGNPRFQDPNITGRGDGSGVDIGAIWVEQTATSNIDLATTVVAGPATGLEDQQATVNWTVQSVGTGTATGSWHDAIYLSASPVFTPDAILLGEVQHTGDLGPGQSYNASRTFTLPGVTPGNYYFLVRCNSENEIFEGTNLANNVMASATPVAMSLPALTLGTPQSGQLATTGASELYQLTTTAVGDLNFTLSGPSGATNELYVSFGNVPTQQSFDARGVRSGSANQSVSLASAQAGTYYVLVYGASAASGESFTLTASMAGFSALERESRRGEQHRAGDAVDLRRRVRREFRARSGGQRRRHHQAACDVLHRLGPDLSDVRPDRPAGRCSRRAGVERRRRRPNRCLGDSTSSPAGLAS